MVRSALRDRLRRRDAEEQAARELEQLASAPNASYQTRLNYSIQHRGISEERGIDISELHATDIPGTIIHRHWNQYVTSPHPYHEMLTREFYASMVPFVFKTRGTVWVRGRQVAISANAINEYLQTPTDPEEEYYEGFPSSANFRPSMGELAANLRRDHSDLWEPGSHHLCHGDLQANLAFWHVFIKCRLIPSTHRTNLSVEAARFLYAIQSGVHFDVGHFIMEEIHKTGDANRGSLPFPSLITYFCIRAGIQDEQVLAELRPPPTPLCKKSYNLYCSRHGLENITSAGRAYRNRAQNRPTTPQPHVIPQPGWGNQQPGRGHPPPAWGTPEIPPPWATQLVHSVDELRTRQETMDSTLHRVE